jgi:hypothetical protein
LTFQHWKGPRYRDRSALEAVMDGVDLMQARVPAQGEGSASAKPDAAVAAAQGAGCGMCAISGSPMQSWLAKRRGWVLLGGAAVAGTGLALGEGWVTVAGLAPLLYTAPCAIMMYFCMRGMNHGTQAAPNQTPASPPATAANAPRADAELENQG